ncbi:MAG: FHA domain-containing protein [Acidobacteriota bacterium]
MFKKLLKLFSREKEKQYSGEKDYNTQFEKPESFHEHTKIEEFDNAGFHKGPGERINLYDEVDILVNGAKISSHRLDNDQTKIGRDPSQADIIIAEPIISKLHCTLEKRGNLLFITDNHSTNGVYINSIKTNEHSLDDKDVISLGRKGTVKIIIHKFKEE